MSKVSHNQSGWIATDADGNKATATFAEGKDKAITDCEKLAKSNQAKEKPNK